MRRANPVAAIHHIAREGMVQFRLTELARAGGKRSPQLWQHELRAETDLIGSQPPTGMPTYTPRCTIFRRSVSHVFSGTIGIATPGSCVYFLNSRLGIAPATQRRAPRGSPQSRASDCRPRDYPPDGKGSSRVRREINLACTNAIDSTPPAPVRSRRHRDHLPCRSRYRHPA